MNVYPRLRNNIIQKIPLSLCRFTRVPEFSPRVCWCLNLFISQESNSGRDCLMEKNRQGDTIQYKKITMLPEMNNMNTEEKRAARCKSIHRRTHRAALSHSVAMTPFLFFLISNQLLVSTWLLYAQNHISTHQGVCIFVYSPPVSLLSICKATLAHHTAKHCSDASGITPG